MSSVEIKKRQLPDWMNKATDNSPKECIVLVERLDAAANLASNNGSDESLEKLSDNTGKSNQENFQPAKRYRTRLSITQNSPIEEGKYVPKPRDRSEPIPRLKPAFIEYKGKIEYYTEFHDIAFAADNLLEWVKKQEKESSSMIPIAFDMEWPFTFQTGPGKTAVIQLCANIELCYVFHIAELKKLPSALVLLLQHDKVALNGVNIKNDCRKLERDFPEVCSDKMVDKCIDLGVYCNSVLSTGGRWSMERLVWHLLRLKINKDKKVRNSKWHIMPLSPEQQIYAAIDVYISQVMFHKLKKTEIEKESEAKKFIEEFGEAAYIATQKLL